MAEPTDLITSAFAQQLPQLAALYNSGASGQALLATLISASSIQIQKYCRRWFNSATYTEYLSGAGIPYDECVLPEFPVSAIIRVATNPVQALLVSNTNTTTNQRATVETTSTGINLRRWASAVETDNLNLLYADYPTLTTMAGAIAACGGGWTAQPLGGYSLYASADLRNPEGQVTAISGGATLELFTEELPTWQTAAMNPDGTGFAYNGTYGWRIDTGSGRLVGYFPGGRLNVRIDYTAGFSVIPADLQQATAMQVQFLYQNLSHDFNLQSEKIGPYAKTMAEAVQIPPAVKAIINPYRDLSKNFWTEKN